MSRYCDINFVKGTKLRKRVTFVYSAHQSHKTHVGLIFVAKSHQNTLQNNQKLLRRREAHSSLVLGLAFS
ncbi:hypothetical protein J1N35_025788, partial [Gossypium stocksii]